MSIFGTVVRSVVSLAMIGAAILIVLAWGRAEPEKAERSTDLAPAVEVASVVDHQGGVRFTVDGEVQPHREVELAAQVAGVVVHKAPNCRVGRAVRANELLVRIDSADYEIAVKQLEEQLQQAEGSLAELDVEIENSGEQISLAEEQLKLQQRELNRYLGTRDPGVFSPSQIDAAKRNELESRNALQSLQNQLRLLQARRNRLSGGIELVQQQLAKARLDLQRTEIRSPLDGVITMEHVEQDGYLQKGASIVTVQDASSLDVACSLYMQQMDWLWQGGERPSYVSEAESDQAGASSQAVDAYRFPVTPVQVRYVLNGRTYVWEGVLDRFDGGGLDPATRMIPCRVHVPRPTSCTRCDSAEDSPGMLPPTLMRGMYVKVDVTAQPPLTLLRMPERALRPGNVVWVVREGRLHRTQVKVAQTDADEVLVHASPDGPQAGDQVVVSPLATPVDGQQVDVKATT